MKKAIALFTIAGCLLVLFTRCNKTNDVASSEVRVFNIDPNLPAQDMYLNNQVQLSNLAYDGDSLHTSIQPGTYNIAFANTGTTNVNPGYNIDFTNGRNYMMFLFNNGGKAQFEAFDESYLRMGIDTSEIRIFNFSPNFPLSDIAFHNEDPTKLDTNYTYYTKRYFNDVYANRDLTTFKLIPSGTHYLKFRAPGTTFAYDSVLVTLADRKSYTVLIRGYYDSTVAPVKIELIQH